MRTAQVFAIGLLALGASGPTAAQGKKMVMASDIPVSHTPPGPRGYGRTFPPPVLKTCTEPLVAGAPDLRGIWKPIAHNGKPPEASSRFYTYAERIEQCGDRIVDMGGGTIADARADGTEEHGVHDVAERDKTTRITVVATFEDGVHVLRPVGIPIEVRRRMESTPDGEQLVWDYVGFTARLDRIDEVDGMTNGTADGQVEGETR